MFFAYVVRDVVEIEPVYFPSKLARRAVASTSSAHAPLAERHDAATGLTSSSPSAPTTPTAKPYELSLDEIVQHRITETYVGKVLPGKGLCVALVNVMSFTDSEIKGPSGAAWLTATFALCVFSPRPGARLRANIVDQNNTGIYLTIDFLSAFPFFVPASELIPGSVFDTTARAWCVPVEVEEATEASGAPLVNYYGLDEDVVVKVLQCIVRLESEVRASHEEGHPAPLMELVGSFVGDGLGPVAWFEEEEEPGGDVTGTHDGHA